MVRSRQEVLLRCADCGRALVYRTGDRLRLPVKNPEIALGPDGVTPVLFFDCPQCGCGMRFNNPPKHLRARPDAVRSAPKTGDTLPKNEKEAEVTGPAPNNSPSGGI